MSPDGSVSHLYITCPICGSDRVVSCDSMKQYFYRKKPDPFNCSSCKIKKRWQDPEYRKKSSIANKNSAVSSSSRISESVKSLWSTSEYRSKRRPRKEKKLLTPEQRSSLQSEKSKKLWSDPNYRATMMKACTEEFRAKQSENSKEIWKNPDFREKVKSRWKDESLLSSYSERSKELFKNPDFRSKWEQKTWSDPSYKEKIASGISSFLSSGKDSSLERVTQEILTSLGVDWERQHRIGPYSFDLYVPSEKILIECQGEYWHSLPEAKSRDSSKFKYIDEYFPNYRVLYLHERDFMNVESVKEKISSFLNLRMDLLPVVQDFSFSDISIKECLLSEKDPRSHISYSEEFLRSFHYAQYGRSAKKVYGAFLNGKLIAVSKFSNVIRTQSATSLGIHQSKVLELDRFCIHPNFQKKNFASWFLSRSVNLIWSAFPSVQTVISFSDSTRGHSGTIYKASNWETVGTIPADYHYVSKDGFVIHKKTLWNHSSKNRMKESEFASLNGYVKVFGKPKTKFRIDRKHWSS